VVGMAITVLEKQADTVVASAILRPRLARSEAAWLTSRFLTARQSPGGLMAFGGNGSTISSGQNPTTVPADAKMRRSLRCQSATHRIDHA